MNGYTSTNRSLGNALLAFVGGMVVWAVFGNRIKQRVNENQTFQEMKAQVMNKVGQFSEMSESKYNQIVDEVSRSYSKAKGISDNELKDLVDDLKYHWARIKDRWNQPTPPSEPAKLADHNLRANTPGTPPSADRNNFDDGFNFNS